MPDFKRKNIRLKDFDYSAADYAYFVTICLKDMNESYLSAKLGDLICDQLHERIKSKEITLYCFCVMPNHLHLLLSLEESYKQSLSVWVSSFKRLVAKEAKDKYGITNLWQKNYYDHIVRSSESMENIAEYILNNPVRKGFVERWENYLYSKICV